MDMGTRIKELRTLAGLSQEELGARLGVQKAAVNKWECGRVKNIKSRHIKQMADIFNVSPSYVMALEDEQTEEAKSIGELIEMEMQRQNLTKKQLCKKAHITEEEYNEILYGTNRVFMLDRLLSVGEALQVGYSYFFYGNTVQDITANITALIEINEDDPDEIASKLQIDLQNPTFKHLATLAEYYGYELPDMVFKDFVAAKEDAYKAAKVRALRYVALMQEALTK